MNCCLYAPENKTVHLSLIHISDCILSHDFALDAAKLAKTHYGIRCMVMPYFTAGSQNPGQRELDFCIHYRYETQKAILSDLVASLYAQGSVSYTHQMCIRDSKNTGHK